MSAPVPVIVLGGSGYVAGELLRLVAQHPRLTLAMAVSSSQAGEPIRASFPHLAPLYAEDRFVSFDAALARLGEHPQWVVLSGAPHGASAELVDTLLASAQAADVRVNVVDASADFRFPSAESFAEVYGHAHAAPGRLTEFRCAVPEHLPQIDTAHAAHPGCFATAMLLAIVPLMQRGLTESEFFVSAVTGSTGAGRSPQDTTHHPLRQSNLFAYQPLRHRHAPEVRALTRAASGRDIGLHFVPHSGPFARGIHATIFAARASGVDRERLTEALTDFYAHSRFVGVDSEPPRMKDIVASNYARLGVSVEGDTVVVCCVLDNLLKGAAGGSMQWVNRLLGYPDDEGLISPAAGWV